MLPPHELKNNEFTKVLRGYNTVEVDEHIKFMLDKYAELYRHNNEMERELRTMTAHFAELSSNEEAIRRAMVNAQRSEHKIISEAEERADLLTRTARHNCDKILVDFRNKIRAERIMLHKLRNAVAEFKEKALLHYHTHLEFINQISPTSGIDPEWELSDEDYANEVLEQMKLDIAQNLRPSSESESVSMPLNTVKDNESQPVRRRALKKTVTVVKKEVLPGDELIDTAIAEAPDRTISFDPVINTSSQDDISAAPTQEIETQHFDV